MSQSGHSRHFGRVPVTSDLPLRTDMVGPLQHVGKVPDSDVSTSPSIKSVRRLAE